MFRFDCEQCGKSIKAPEDAVGKIAQCPKCKYVFTVPSVPQPFNFFESSDSIIELQYQPGTLPPSSPEPPYELVDQPAPIEQPPPDVPIRRKKPSVPDGLAIAVYGTTAAAVITAAMPCIWLLSMPLAAFALIVALYLPTKYRTSGWHTLCACLSALVLLVGIAAAKEVTRTLERIAREG